MMLKKIWEMLKENYMVILAIFTTIFTIVYATLKLAIYVYWSGYFHELNIDSSFMRINYDGFVFQAIFFSVIVIIILYLTWMVNGIFTNIQKRLWKKEAKPIEKVGVFIKIGVLDALVCGIFLSIANGPLVIVVCVWRQIELSFINIFITLSYLCIAEILILIIQKINADDKNATKKSLESRILTVLLLTLTFAGFGLAGTYYYGSKALEENKEIRFVGNEQYAITYSDGDKYILHKIQFDGIMVTINRNEQKIISNENCTYIVRHIDKIVISD